MKRQSLLRDPSRLPVLAASVAVVFCFLWAAPFTPRPTTVWRGFYTLAAREGSPASGRLSRLSARLAAGRKLVMRETAPVSFADFVGLERTVVGDMEKRLDTADPRFDPFMRGLPGYFQSRGMSARWNLVYIPAYRGRLSVFAALSGTLGPPGRAGWRLVDFDPWAALAASAAALAYAVILCLPLKGRRRGLLLPSMGCALLWIPFLAGGGPAGLCLFFLLYAAWHRLMERCMSYAKDAIIHNWKDPAQREIAERLSAFLLLAALLPVLLALATESGPSRVFHLAGTILASLFLLIAPFPLYALKAFARKRRTPFEPVPILRHHSWPAAYRRALVILAVAAAGTLCVLAAARGTPLPAPGRIPGIRGITWETLARAEAVAVPGSLPGLAEAFAHAAYQEGLPFGRDYRLPSRGERVTVDEYLWSSKDRAVVKRERTVKVYDDAWLGRVIGSAGQGSVEWLLAAQGRPAVVLTAGPARLVLRDLPFVILCLAVLAAGVLAELGLGPLISGKLWRFNVPARRRQPL